MFQAVRFCRSFFLILFTFFAITAISSAQADSNKVKVRTGQEILVTLPEGSSVQHVSESRIASKKTKGKTYLVLSLNDGAAVAHFSSNVSEQDRGPITRFCRRFLKHNPTATCEPNTILQQQVEPNDARYSEMYDLNIIGAPTAWDTTTGSSLVKVAVVDTGIDYTHPELSGNMAVNTNEIPGNGVDDDGNGYVDDYYGYDFSDNDGDPLDENSHGSHVSGTIGATGNNGSGTTGINWTVGLIGARVLDAGGYGSLSDIAQGVDYAVARGAHVINMSIGASDNSRALRTAIKNAKYSDVLCVIAAGNESANNNSTFSFPASYNLSNIIAVAASDQNDELADFSNYGSLSVHLAAPGVSILSTVLGGAFDSYDGTSMASPHVAGAAALIKSANTSLHAADLKSVILNTVDPVSSFSGYTITGGRLNLANAIAAAPSTVAQPLPSRSDDSIKITISAKGSAKSSKASIKGKISDAEGVMPGESLDLTCGRALKGSAFSSLSGSFTIKAKRTTKNMRCQITDTAGNRSSKFTVAAHKSR